MLEYLSSLARRKLMKIIIICKEEKQGQDEIEHQTTTRTVVIASASNITMIAFISNSLSYEHNFSYEFKEKKFHTKKCMTKGTGCS
jgi:hypothetical protein